ncbi:MAG TPA: peptidoglycan DD-metalloendopeptidase family protein [Vicinamibacterales bacterium]|nr:peptidoglycan DD-metalloendopeptidase family protein [Vicinamibacterales bacterium]
MSKRYTIVLADRQTGTVRRVTIRLRPFAMAFVAVLAFPVLVGLGLRLSATAEVNHLRATNSTLEQENSSYREATGTLAAQIESLQAAIGELGVRSQLDPISARAMEKLPSNVKNHAVGGTSIEGASAMLTPQINTSSASSLDQTFTMLRNVLGSLEGHLSTVRRNVEKRESLMNATPSIWPVHGWLSAGYGMRADPFNGERDFHPGLDISADKGTPIVATAAGRVELAAPSGDYGNLVIVDHGYGLVTRYGHLSKFAVWAGREVKRGDVIGYVGATGRATGPHLHYEVLANGKLINPMQLLTGRSAKN